MWLAALGSLRRGPHAVEIVVDGIGRLGRLGLFTLAKLVVSVGEQDGGGDEKNDEGEECHFWVCCFLSRLDAL